jgi:hypothetical protein
MKAFTVEIGKTKNVSILKDLIKEMKAPHLDHVAASDLDLWNVSIPVDDDTDERLKSINNLEPLDALLRLSDVFLMLKKVTCTSSFKHQLTVSFESFRPFSTEVTISSMWATSFCRAATCTSVHGVARYLTNVLSGARSSGKTSPDN